MSAFNTLLPFCSIEHFERGQTIFRPDRPKVGLVVGGVVDVAWDFEGGMVALACRGEGRIIGAEGLILGHCPFTVSATNRTTFAWLSPGKLQSVLERLPSDQWQAVWRELQESVLAMQMELLQRISLRGSAKERVIRTLRKLADEEGQAIRISCERLGQLCGITRESANYALLALRREGYVERQGQTLILRTI
jgi:CRP-like cAMP-binding protein